MDNKSLVFYTKNGFWSMDINDALFIKTKKEVNSVIEVNKN